MNVKKTFVAAAMVSVATLLSYADQGDIVVSFSTPGPDKYADGQTVNDDEWYALVWSSDGVFDGLKTDGTPLDPNDEVIITAPLAKGGKCPSTAFEFARKDKYEKGGEFSILLLDTRDANGNSAQTRADVFVKQGTVASVVAGAGNASGEASTVVPVGGASVAWATPTVLGEAQIDKVEGAAIKSFEVVGANVQITVAGVPSASSVFVVRTGESVDTMSTYEILTPKGSASDETTFIVPKEKGNFFSAGTLAK